jgi:hypothetical protein
MNRNKLYFDEDTTNKCGYAKLNYDHDCDINKILSKEVMIYVLKNNSEYRDTVSYSNILINSFMCNILFDTDCICLHIPLFISYHVDCYSFNNYNNIIMEKLHLVEQSFEYCVRDMKYSNYIDEDRHPIVIIIQLDNTDDDLSISKILLRIEYCGEPYILKDNYFIKRYLGFNILVIFLCENINSLNEIKKVDDFIEEYKPLEITKLILGKYVGQFKIYDENDKLLKFKNYVSI